MTDETPHSGEQRSRNSRRNILRLGGVAAASLVGASTAGVVSAQDDDGPDTDFDPDDEKAALDFLLEMFEIQSERSEEEACLCTEEYWHELTTEQNHAVADQFEDNLEWTVNRKPKTTAQAQIASNTWIPGDEDVVAEGELFGEYHVYDHIQEVTWDYNGDDYRNPNQEHEYECYGLACSFKGITTKEITPRTTYFDAELAAEYAFDPPSNFERRVEAVIESRAHREGGFEVLEEDAPA
ncbi:hypothetical protein AB7C87_10795 [Natrarchaeobius sp. A-rgal3]|uniref:hypothetical protein n=1 Tax=Natrarchaeobius versutus TaxID=1679078 RepID=UPI0035107A86